MVENRPQPGQRARVVLQVEEWLELAQDEGCAEAPSPPGDDALDGSSDRNGGRGRRERDEPYES